MYDGLYCKVFIDAEMDYARLFDLIMNCVAGKKEGIDYIITDWCDISVQRNKEYKLEQYLKDSTDFLYWKYYLDIEPLNVDETQYINNVANLLRYLKEYGMRVIIACDFEEEVNTIKIV
ncbi:MAG: hypothetical protein IJN16_07230 [Lachnospiraceae bacterium]|nr:hypothetical protein [Lachnospiraceae bacterium]